MNLEKLTEPRLEQNPAISVEEKRELLGRLLARLAHEIRNPLSSLDIHFQLLEEDVAELAPAGRQRLGPRFDIIHGELHRLKKIVENFLRLAGPSTVDLEPIDLSTTVRHVCALLAPEAASRQIRLSMEAVADLPRVSADPVRLTQALINLVINGIQAVGKEGEVTILLASSVDEVVIAIRDTGPGIEPHRLASIFDPFYTTKTEGSGLGLWIAQQIVVAHGGTLEARNVEPGGALFTVHLPVKLQESFSRSLGGEAS